MSSPAQKTRLTADQKKQNHIESERKRREAIRQGFETLSEIVPDSKGKASSEGVVLGNALQHIKNLQAKKDELRKEAQAKNAMSPLEFEQHYRDVRNKMRAEREGKESRSASGDGTPVADANPGRTMSGRADANYRTMSGGGDSSKQSKVRGVPAHVPVSLPLPSY